MSDNNVTDDAHEQNNDDAEYGHGDDLPPGFEPDFGEEDAMQDDGVQVVNVEGLGRAAATLINFGDIERHQRTGSDGVEFDATVLARLIRSNYVEPGFDDLDAEGVRQMKPAKPGKLLEAIVDDDDADVDVAADGTARVSTGEGN